MNKLLIVAVLLATTEGIILRQDAKQATDTCDQLRCKDSAPLAERLSKLALLPDFVTQTLLLLEDLMKEMDSELQRSASYLLKNIGSECSGTYSILQEVLQKQRMREGRKSSSLGFGVEPLAPEPEAIGPISTGSSHRESSNPNKHNNKWTNGHSNTNKWSTQESKSHGSTGHKKTNKWSTQEGSSQGSSGHKNTNKWSTQQGSSHDSTGPKNANKWSSQDSKSHDLTSSEKRGGKWQQSKYYTNREHSAAASHRDNRQRESEADQWDSEDHQERTHNHRGEGIEQYSEETSDNTQCRGVDKGSPFWVPGLDTWCVQNCAVGYCPTTHCNC